MKVKKRISPQEILLAKLQTISNPLYPTRNDKTPPDKVKYVIKNLVGDVRNRSFQAYGDHAEAFFTEAVRQGASLNSEPYDIILLYDVLDHVHDQRTYLNEITKELDDNGMIVARCHPWCDKNACHIDPIFEKVYLHFLFTEEERNLLAMYGKPTTGIGNDPLPMYYQWFKDANLRIIYEETINAPIEPIFTEKFIELYFGLNHLPEVHFVDFILKKDNI